MNKIFSKILRRSVLITLFGGQFLPIIAAPGDHGRWYSLDDSSSSMSPLGFIIGGIVLTFLSYILLRVDIESKKSGKKSPIGLSIFGIIGGVICIIVGFAKCSS